MKKFSPPPYTRLNRVCMLTTSVLLLFSGSPAFAYMGNFEQTAGYIPFMSAGLPSANVAGDWQNGTGFVHPPFSFNSGTNTYGRVTPDFTRYNAGQTGGFVDIADNTGLWVAAPGSGGRPQSDAANGAANIQFVAIHDGSGRPAGDQNVLCLRTVDSTSALDYRYTLDSRDLAGIVPGDLTDAIYTFDYVFCPVAGADSSNISMLGFADDSLTTALQVGTSGLGNFQYRAGSSGAITTTATMIGFSGWSEVSIVINAATDRASIRVRPWDDATNSLGAATVIASNLAVTNLSKITKLNFVQVAHVEKYFYDGFVMSASGGNLTCVGSLVANSSYENGNFSNFTTSDPDINGTLQTFGGSQSVFLSLDPGGNTLPDTPITGFRANTGNWVDATTNGGLGAKDGNRLFVIPPNLGANKCLYPNSSLGFITQTGTCYRVCVWAAQFDVSSPNNPSLESDFNFEYGDINGVADPGATANYSILPTAIDEAGSWNAITWKLPASTNVKDLNGNLYTGAVGQVVDWRTLNWQRICFDFTPSVTSARLETYMSSTSLNNGIALDGMCVELCDVAGPACDITDVVVTPGACNDNGTPADAADDYYTASVAVTFSDKPATGNLVLSGVALHSANSVTTVAVGSTTTATTHNFVGVKLKANGVANAITATFSADPACTMTVNASTVANCSANCPSYPPVEDSITVACNTAVNKQLSTAGGVAPYTYVVTGGALPTGLSLTPGGLLSGDPSVVGTFSVSITVTDDEGCSGVINLEIIVSPCYSLGNFVWNDSGAGGGTLNDGIRNGAEPAISGVLVELLDGSGNPYNPGSGVVTTSTNANGYYRFDNLPAGNYCVRVAASNFNAGNPLNGFISSAGQSTDFTVAGNNKDHGAPSGASVTSTKVTLGASNPAGDKDAGATGAGDNGPEGDANDNLVVDFGFFIVPANCLVSNIAVTPGACNDNGTPADAADDYYTADVTVSYSNKPASGNLVLSGNALHSSNSVTTVAVGSTGASSHIFAGVRLKANGVVNTITASFSADGACTLSQDAPSVDNCSVPLCDITDLAVTPGACNDNGTPENEADDYYTASVSVTFTNKPATGNLVLSGAALHSGNSVTSVAVGSTTSATTHYFVGVKLKANGVANVITATFSAAPDCNMSTNSVSVPECSTPPVECCPLIILGAP